MIMAVLVGGVDGLRDFHLSSTAFGAKDHREDVEDEADGSKRPPEPSKVHAVAVSAFLAVAHIV